MSAVPDDGRHGREGVLSGAALRTCRGEEEPCGECCVLRLSRLLPWRGGQAAVWGDRARFVGLFCYTSAGAREGPVVGAVRCP